MHCACSALEHLLTLPSPQLWKIKRREIANNFQTVTWIESSASLLCTFLDSSPEEREKNNDRTNEEPL